MLDTVKRTISDYTMLETGENVLVALSGGADSVALLLSLRELGYPVRTFHLNHCLRSAESVSYTHLHHNAANTTARGAEILAQIADKNGGPTKILAQALLDEYEKLGVPIRQIVFREGSHGDYYYTNRAAAALNIPALTSEFCFIDNEEDQKFIDSEEDWQKQARAQCNAILYYFTQVQY